LNDVTQFGPYKLIDRISVGGMAEVYKAIEYGVEGFERLVAVKRILPHIAEDDEFITMFKDEAKIAGQLNHSNIAQIYNLGQQDDSFYIALEYIAGKDLRALFTRCAQSGKAMPIAQGCFIVMKVCEGLDYAHNKKDKYGRHLNIIHRDVSPPNALVSYEGEVKLIDFGVAKAAGRVSRTQAGILKGKFGYMSPEQVRGLPLDRRSDIFALGVVLYELLTGVRLFQGDTDFATLEMVRTVDVPPPSSRNAEIPQALEKVVMKALSGEPETRYQTAMELHDDLQSFMFAAGMFYSRKDLAAWMRKMYAKEIEAEKQAAGPPPPPPPPGAGRKKTTQVPAPAPAAPAVKPPSIRLGAGPEKKEEPEVGPNEEQQAALRKRSKTMLMSGSRPSTLKPGAAAPAAAARPTGGKPGLAAPVSAGPQPTGAPPRAGNPKGGGSDLDWDDDELETKLFDEAPGQQPASAEAAANEPEEPRGPAQPIAAAPAPAQPIAAARPAPAVSPAQPIAAARPATAPAQPIAAARAAQPIAAAQSPQPIPAQPVSTLPAHEDEPLRRKLPLGLIIMLASALVVLLGLVAYLLSDGDEKVEEVPKDSEPVVAAVASLTVEIKPQDAVLAVDGKDQPGGASRVVSLTPGKHLVVVSKGDEYLPFEQEVEVVAGSPVVLPVKLALKEVALTLDVEPAGAAVNLVEGETVTPIGKAGETYKLIRKPNTSYALEASLAGYSTSRAPISFTGEAVQSVKLALVKDPAVTPTPTPTPTPTRRLRRR
jgi:hypothetical protein